MYWLDIHRICGHVRRYHRLGSRWRKRLCDQDLYCRDGGCATGTFPYIDHAHKDSLCYSHGNPSDFRDTYHDRFSNDDTLTHSHSHQHDGGEQFSCAHADKDTYQDSNADSKSHANTYKDPHADSCAQSHPNGSTYSDQCAESHPYSNEHQADVYQATNSYSQANQNASSTCYEYANTARYRHAPAAKYTYRPANYSAANNLSITLGSLNQLK